jgi:pyruvyltransferase
MKHINLIYWNEANFGDLLSPILIQELSGRPILYKNSTLSIKARITIIAKGILTLRFKRIKTIIFPLQKTLLGIGSIITWGNRYSAVWGAGFMNRDETYRSSNNIYLVRGKLTDMRLKELGYKGCSNYGDPALLLPLLYNNTTPKKNRLGIIPHWREVDDFNRLYGDKYYIINLRTRDVKKVIQEIQSCQYILSTSLHGIIVAHAYHIPALWIEKGNIGTDGFKFHDYFSSVDIPFYDGFKNIEEILACEENWMELFQKNMDKSTITISLNEIQKKILRSAPFPLSEKYKTVIE